VVISISTFGPAFFLALGFFEEEQSASFTFGLIISIAGIVGTPMGGVLIDRVSKNKGDNDGSFEDSIDESVDEAETKYKTIEKIMLVMTAVLIVGGVFVWALVFVESKVLFIISILFGCTALFSSTSCFNLGAMLAVPSKNRGFAVGLLTLVRT